MDLLAQHEAFLRAIFDAPGDDTPRLVYADFLQENGEDDRAELIRVQCELARMNDDCDPGRWAALEERNQWLSQVAVPWNKVRTGNGVTMNRGLWRESFAEGVAVTVEDLDDPLKFREWVVRVNPAWYGETKLYVRAESRLEHDWVVGAQLQSTHTHALYGLPFTQQVTDWNLSGHLVECNPPPPDLSDFLPFVNGGPQPGDMVICPALSQSAVDGLVRHKGVKRIRTLDLRNNRLGGEAVRLLVKSPYLENLQCLRLLDGNHLRGKLWQEVIERFGEDVVE
ncbi:TIGR02996 domain-containing protein [Gemmata sp.]|uniref:TIGR02996 domain-containing protein n=1 Tax=Gemmata sp. TaxID=1914242 RepID=UPI003F6FB99D